MRTQARQALDAIFEGGVFRPLEPTELPEGTRVHLILESSTQPSQTPFELLLQVYNGLTPDQVSEIERIALDRSHFMSPASTS